MTMRELIIQQVARKLGIAFQDSPDSYSWNDWWLASMATETGPTEATASIKACSSPLATSVNPVTSAESHDAL